MAEAVAEQIDYRGLSAVRLQTGTGASAVVTSYGAQLLSWIPAQGGERLYLSEQADFSGQKPIRGGVPVLFPQFGTRGSLPKHGLVRDRAWKMVKMHAEKSYASATFRIESDAETLAIWPYAFALELTVMIEANRLDIELEVQNTAAQPFAFTAGLHTYCATGNVEMARLQGLEGLAWLDALKDLERIGDTPEFVFVDAPVDRVYLNARKPLLLTEPARHLAIEQQGFRDVVVWNPWESGIAGFPDMAPGDYKKMLCVEAAAFNQPVTVAPGEDWAGRQTLIALPPGGLAG